MPNAAGTTANDVPVSASAARRRPSGHLSSEVTVTKRGFERAVELWSRNYSMVYGLMAVALSVFMGWAAGRVFALG